MHSHLHTGRELHTRAKSDAGDDNERSTIEEDIPVKNETPLFSGEEEYRQDQEEKVGSNSFLEEIKETDSGDQSYITSDETNTLNEQIINQEVSFNYMNSFNLVPFLRFSSNILSRLLIK